jgi:hypothetical protein
MVIPDVNLRPQPAEVRLRTGGPITATLSLLDQPPLNVMQRAGRPVGLAEGRAEMEATIALTLKDRIDIKDISYEVAGRLLDVSSDKLVQGRDFATPTLALTASTEGVEISGVARMGNLPMDIRWRQGLGPDADGTSIVEGTMEISAAFLEEFGIDLPAGSVRGTGIGQITLEMQEDAAPKFRLTSDLRGIALKIESIAWVKSATAKGRLVVTGTLGETPAIDRVEIEGGGLTYRRGEGPRLPLTPVGGDAFLVGDLDQFRIRFERDEAGRVVRLVGLYADGREEPSARSEEPPPAARELEPRG